MDAAELTGYYTYRSMRDTLESGSGFDGIPFPEGEFFLAAQADRTLTGTLSFPASAGAAEKSVLDLRGTVSTWTPLTFTVTGTGRPGTKIADFHYELDGSALRRWTEPAIGQRRALAGTVLRAKDHGDGEHLAPAGAVASFVAVKREFVPPRAVPGLALPANAVAELASPAHRLHHTTWHLVRNVWRAPLSDADRAEITRLGWGFARPPLTATRALDLTNGAGEDFLFMHRKMIARVRRLHEEAGVPPIQGWRALPGPDLPQFVYVEQDDPQTPGLRVSRLAADRSGFMVPPADEEFLGIFDEGSRQGLAFLKTPAYFGSVMRPLEQQFRSPRHLAGLSLGALGNLLEYTIHNAMHMRWASVPRDPASGAVAARGTFDFDTRWEDPANDYLGDFYSSHVNPLFWRLHGWVDDRIEDWFRAHEAAAPGQVVRRDHEGVPWFSPGMWVQAADPFDRPAGHDHGHGHDDGEAVQVMRKVLEVVRVAVEAAAPPPLADTDRRAGRVPPLTSFLTWVEPSMAPAVAGPMSDPAPAG